MGRMLDIPRKTRGQGGTLFTALNEMSDLLRKPWILPATLRVIGGPVQDGDVEWNMNKLVQLVEVTVILHIWLKFVKIHRSGTSVKAKVSDKFNYNVAVLTPESIEEFKK